MPRTPDPMAETSGGSERKGVALAEYGINDLPRDAALRVLSCLDARAVVRSCVLSRRWRDLWRDVPRISASLHEFEANADGRDGGYRKRNRLFKKFVNRLLMLRNPTALDEFRLSYSIGPQLDCAEAHLWIGHALLCNARSVEVFAWGDRLELDPAVFTSEHLTSLLFHSVSLTPSFFGQLQTGCQALESLILQNCLINDIEISSQTLKFLSIGRDCEFTSDDRATISAPSLIHLGFLGHSPYDKIPLLKNMGSLETAYISLGRFQSTGIQVDDIHQFLQGLSDVRKLDFYFVQTELTIGKNSQWCPKFSNLKFLTLGEWCLVADFYALIVFLQNSPILEQLTLNLKEDFHILGRITGDLKERSFTCKHLEIVEIICLAHHPMVDSLKKFLLGSGIASGQIHIKN